MYASYLGKKSRSLSTADVYRIAAADDGDGDGDGDGDDDNTEKKMAPIRMSFSTLRRPVRRPTTRPPPVPKRSDSFCSTTGVVRSYLTDDIRRKFASTARVDADNDDSSPRSTNFVKKLVATLERRQKDNEAVGGGAISTHDIYKRSFRELSRDDRSMIAANVEPILPPPPNFSTRCKSSQLEELQEAAAAESEYDDLDSSDPDEYFSGTCRAQQDCSRPSSMVCSAYPIINSAASDKSKSSKRSSLKNVLSSLINWRIGGGGGGGGGGKTLPKGSRYYTTRESLGEEMRAFRCDTMPKLMERAAVNSQLPDLFRKRTSERPRRETQDFAKLIKRPSIEKKHAQPSPQSIATIHPVYGSNKAAAVSQRLYSSRFHHEQATFDPTLPPPAQIYANSPPVAPALPPPATTSSPAFSDEHLLRPSRLRELHKRLSREVVCAGNIATIQLRSSVTYDVPRSNRPVAVVQEYQPSATAHYQNVGQCGNDDDERLSCTLFTTF